MTIGGVLQHNGATLGVLGKASATQAADVGALTDNTGAAADSTVVDVMTLAVADPAKVNANFADLAKKFNDMRAVLQRHGLMA